jgi:glutamate-1-semialdehyde 2,1-aminomutase
MGGGMPVAAIAGRADIMKLCGREGGVKVRASGGTYSGHPASMLAAKTMMSFLVANEGLVYQRIAALGAGLRSTVESAFAAEGIYVKCTGYPNAVVAGSAMAMPHFLLQPGHPLSSPDDVNNPDICDAHLREHVFQLALLCEDVNVVHGLGAASTAHTEDDLAFFGAACSRVARRLKPYLS